MVDFFVNVPVIVIDNILQRLPIRTAAQTSVLSKRWRRAWLSLTVLSFDENFWEDQEIYDWQKLSQIISDILFYHNGPVHKFYLHTLFNTPKDCLSYNQWISFLSKNGVREISIIYRYPLSRMDITSYIFRCSEIVELWLSGCNLSSPPTDFSGFPNLRKLELTNVHFSKPNIIRILIENCKMLETLELWMCVGMDHVVVDLPRLQSITLYGVFESLAFRNVRSLKSISLHSEESWTLKSFDAVNLLANSCPLQSITFDNHILRFFVAGVIQRSSSVAFNFLDELCLSALNLSDFGVFRDVLYMIECCPYIKKLNLLLYSNENVSEDMIRFNYNHKLDRLREVNIDGITGSCGELKLVEYLLAISPVLQNMFFKYYEHVVDSERKMSRTLMGFPRASPKARLFF